MSQKKTYLTLSYLDHSNRFIYFSIVFFFQYCVLVSPPSTPSPTGNPTPSTPSHVTRSNDTYVYGVGMLAVLAIGVCVFFTYNTSQAENKKLVNEKQDQPPKRCHML